MSSGSITVGVGKGGYVSGGEGGREDKNASKEEVGELGSDSEGKDGGRRECANEGGRKTTYEQVRTT